MLDKGSPLTACVSKAVDELGDNGDLSRLQKEWLDRRRKRARAVVTTAAIDRVAYRQARARGPRWSRSVSTVVFAAVLLLAVTSSPGWPRVRDSFFNLRVGWREPAGAVGRVVAERPGARGLPGVDADRRARAGRGADAARSGVVSVAGVGHRVRRPVPGPAPADLPVPRRVRPARAAALGHAERTRCCSAVLRWC